MGIAYQASKLVDEAIVQILTQGGLYDQGRALVLRAKCLVAVAPPPPNPKRDIAILNAIKALLKAKAHFSKTEAFGRVKSTLHLLSILYNELDMKKDRNHCAFEFRQLDEQYPAKLNTISLY